MALHDDHHRTLTKRRPPHVVVADSRSCSWSRSTGSARLRRMTGSSDSTPKGSDRTLSAESQQPFQTPLPQASRVRNVGPGRPSGEMIFPGLGFGGRSRASPIRPRRVSWPSLDPGGRYGSFWCVRRGPRSGSCCPDPPQPVVWHRIGMPNRLIDQLETRFSTTNEPTHPPFDNEMKGSSCTITHITTSQAGTRCPTTATTSSPSPLMTPRVSAVSHRTPLRATRMCNELRAVNWSTG